MTQPTQPSIPRPGRIDPADEVGFKSWCEHFGVTPEQLTEALKAVGDAPAAVREHLLNQGSSAGAG